MLGAMRNVATLTSAIAASSKAGGAQNGGLAGEDRYRYIRDEVWLTSFHLCTPSRQHSKDKSQSRGRHGQEWGRTERTIEGGRLQFPRTPIFSVGIALNFVKQYLRPHRENASTAPSVFIRVFFVALCFVLTGLDRDCLWCVFLWCHC